MKEEHQNSSKETLKKVIKNHKNLKKNPIQSHLQIQHQENFKDEHVPSLHFF